MADPDDSPKPAPSAAELRRQRVADALRRNLRRRKAAAEHVSEETPADRDPATRPD